MIKNWNITATFFFLFIAQTAFSQQAGDVLIVAVPQAAIYTTSGANADASPSVKSSSVLPQGRRVQAAGPEENGFVPLSTRQGGKAWVRASDLTPEVAQSSEPQVSAQDVAEPPLPRARPARRASQARESAGSNSSLGSRFGLKRATFDLGFSAGSYADITYTEVNLGLNLYFLEWLAWRNAIFGRFPSRGNSMYGLDSSARFILNLDGGALGLTAFVGPGYRFANLGGNVPFAEAGVVLKIAGIALGGGVKTLLNSWTTAGVANDTQYFIILAGGGSL